MQRRFESLDGFRGMCAVFVMVFHMHIIESITELSFFRHSYIFVDFFFALSGFVLTHSYLKKDNLKFKTFFVSRFFRIYPLHAAMLVVMISFEIVKYFGEIKFGFSFNSPAFSQPNSIVDILPNALLLQSWTQFTDELSFNYPSWSISIEFYTYFIFFATISIFRKSMVAIWIFLVLMSSILFFIDVPIIAKAAFKGLSGFFLGAVSYLIYLKIKNLKLSIVTASLIEVMFILLSIYVTCNIEWLTNIAAKITFSLTIIIFSLELGLFSLILKTKPLQIIGKLSYSIYMTHAAFLFVLFSVVILIGYKFGIETSIMIDGVRNIYVGGYGNALVATSIVIVILISFLTYNLIEIPFQKIGKRINSIVKQKIN